MLVPLTLLLVLAVIGSIDGAYYHTYKFQLFRQPSARVETITHIVRAITLAVAVWILAHAKPLGGWYWALAVLFTVDLVDDIVDIAIEPRSREPMGGLPPLEYLIHMLVMGCSGGTWASFALLGWSWRNEPTRLAPADPSIPSLIVWFARLVAVGALITGLADLARLVRSVHRDGWKPEPKSTRSTPSPRSARSIPRGNLRRTRCALPRARLRAKASTRPRSSVDRAAVS